MAFADAPQIIHVLDALARFGVDNGKATGAATRHSSR